MPNTNEDQTKKSTSRTSTNGCHCGSALSFEQCCQPILKKKKASKTAEDLLRARYSAFCTQSIDFILESHHSETKKDVSEKEIRDWSTNSKWLGLEIIQKELGLESDSEGMIVFKAFYESNGKPETHAEKAHFKKENGDWKFFDAEGVHVGTYQREEPKLGRNDPCSCGSGKKYKKCCLNTQ